MSLLTPLNPGTNSTEASVMDQPKCDSAPSTSGTKGQPQKRSDAATPSTPGSLWSHAAELFFRWPCLKSGEPPLDGDPFKHSEKEYQEIGHSWKSKHGNKFLKILDEMLPLIGMGCLLGYKTMVVVWDFIDLTFLVEPTSMGLVMFANDVIEWSIVMGACLMWHTFCYWSDTVHWFWQQGVWPLPSLMPGGFMPRLAAFSLGLLMFTTNTLVSEGRVEGKALLNQFGSQGWDLCRATDMQADHASTMWFARILRRPPSVREKGSSFTCFNVHTHGLLWWSADDLKGTFVERMLKASPLPFDKSRLQAYFDHQNSIASTLNHDVEMPYNGSAPLSHSFGFPMIDVVPVLEDISDGDLTDADFSQHGFHCMYQCTKWKSVGLMSVIEKVGTIVAGSAVVVKTSDTISTNFGGHIWGLPLVQRGTPAATINTIIQTTRTRPGKGRSKLLACGVCCFAMTPLRFASKLNVDGYFTVDYYVTAVFFSSLIMACVVRHFQPYKIMKIAYTEKMWATGVDSFFDTETQTLREIDLYEWIHLSQLARAHHLEGYAQGLSPKKIKAELAKQKKSREALKDPKELEGMEDKKRKHMKKMKEEYHNEHAEVVVKLVREITVSTVSPPHKGDEKLKLQRGSVVCKVVEVRRDAVGTIIGQVNADVVKIRFPKEVPTDPPVMEPFLPYVSLEQEEGGKKKPICFDSGIPIALIDARDTTPLDEKFDPADEKRCETVFSTVVDLDLRRRFKAGEKKWEHQYHMVLTPTFEKKDKCKVNAWFHNAAFRMVNPRPRHMKKDDDDLKKDDDDDDYERKNEKEATKWEDVEVPLVHISEASDEWGEIECERLNWMEEVAAAVLEDDKVEK